MKRLILHPDGSVSKPDPETKPLQAGEAVLHGVGPGNRIEVKQGRAIHVLQRNPNGYLSNTRIKKYSGQKVTIEKSSNGGFRILRGGTVLAYAP